MIQRDAYRELSAWRRSHREKALLVDGARQIGKTFLIEHFAQREYRNYVKVDFLKDDSAAALLSRVSNARGAVEALGLLSGSGLVPGETLVFFDEVQEAPNIVTLSKYLVQDGRFDVIMSGSLLGVEMRHVKSLPVGYLHRIQMHPLTFSEYCRAMGVPAGVMEDLRDCFGRKVPVGEAVHQRMVELFRRYMVIGGMPGVLQSYLDAEGDLGTVRTVQANLIDLYREDIAKHAGARSLQVKAIFDALPAQLASQNKRFLFNKLKVDSRFGEYANDFAWLVGAGVALKVNAVSQAEPMLKRTEERNRFKLYSSDVGMLLAQYPANAALSVLAGLRSVNCGGVYENFVAQELASANISPHYYNNSKKGEVDFLIETNAGAVLPIEVKSGKDYKRHVALNNLMRVQENGIGEALVLSEANVSSEARECGTVHYVPLYMMPFVCEEAATASLEGVKLEPIAW